MDLLGPVSSPKGYQSHCLPNGMGTILYESTVANNNLKPIAGICPDDTITCKDTNTVVKRNPNDNCNFNPCPVLSKNETSSDIVCAKDVKRCKEANIFVSRDPKNKCQFKECPKPSKSTSFSTTA